MLFHICSILDVVQIDGSHAGGLVGSKHPSIWEHVLTTNAIVSQLLTRI